MYHGDVFFPVGFDQESSLALLAGSASFFRSLQTVIERVSHEVDERFVECIHNRTVKFEIRSSNFEPDLLLSRTGEVPDKPGQDAKDALEGREAHPQGLAFEFLERAFQACQSLQERLRVEIARDFPQFRFVQNELSHSIDKTIENFGLHADGAGRRGGFRLCRLFGDGSGRARFRSDRYASFGGGSDTNVDDFRYAPQGLNHFIRM